MNVIDTAIEPDAEEAPIFAGFYRIAQDIQRTKHLIARALPYTHGTHTLDDVCLAIMAGKLRLWTAPEAILVSEFVTYPRKRVLHCFLIAGDLDQVVAMMPALESFALDNGCAAISGLGRPGWAKITKRLGWQTSDRYCILDLKSEDTK